MGSRTGFTDSRESPGVEIRPPGIVGEYVRTALVCGLLLIFLRAFVFQQSEIPSGSMEDTVLIGDYVLVNRFLYAPTSFAWERHLLPRRDIERGDVVVFKHPEQPEQDFIKRVIGLPGDTVALVQGRLFVNGRPVEEPYLNRLYVGRDTFGPVRVDPGRYFLLGDNRSRSSDSRSWGLPARELIKGRAFMVLFSARGRPATDGPPGRVTPKSLARKLYDLVFHSRWDRCFTGIR